MAFRFDIRETFLKAIPRIARERIDRVVESLSEKPLPSGESIHDARKNLKCLRALLRLARGSIESDVRRRENFFFRDAGRSLSAVRDPQALLEALEYFRKRHHSSARSTAPKQELTSTFIKKVYGKIEQEIVDQLPAGAAKKLVGELRGARRSVDHWFDGTMLHPDHEWENFVGVGLRRTYRQGKGLVWQFEVTGKEMANDETWHELRKCAKALGYQLRLFRPIWPEMMKELVDEIDLLTDCLGDANDLAILRRKVLSEPYDPSETQSSAETRRSFLRSLDRRKHKLRLEAFKLARLIYAEKPGQFERRLARYWQIWRSQNNAKETRSNAGINARAGQQSPDNKKADRQLLASS
jgi:CHAD domain-containing protein